MFNLLLHWRYLLFLVKTGYCFAFVYFYIKKEGQKSQKHRQQKLSFTKWDVVCRYYFQLLWLIFRQLSMISPKIVLPHRNTVVKKVKSKEVNVVLVITQILLLHTTDFIWWWEVNPGLGSRVKNDPAKYSICNKAVGTNRKRVKCEVCQHLTHVSCLNISKMQQKITQ